MTASPCRAEPSRKSRASSAYRVGRAPTGLGLFATEPIAKGAFIIDYRGVRITHAEAERREARGARYMFEINSRWTHRRLEPPQPRPLRQPFLPAERRKRTGARAKLILRAIQADRDRATKSPSTTARSISISSSSRSAADASNARADGRTAQDQVDNAATAPRSDHRVRRAASWHDPVPQWRIVAMSLDPAVTFRAPARHRHRRRTAVRPRSRGPAGSSGRFRAPPRSWSRARSSASRDRSSATILPSCSTITGYAAFVGAVIGAAAVLYGWRMVR